MIPHPSMVPAFVAHVCMGLLVAFVLLARFGRDLSVGRALVLLGVTVVGSGALAFATAPGPGPFPKLLALSWTLAVVLPATAFGIAVRATPHRRLQTAFVSLGLLGIVSAVYAFVWEPNNLEVTHHEVHSDRLRTPLRIAVVADLQTDAPGDHERAALQAVRDANPDLIVFVGDVIQHADPTAYADAWATLRSLGPPLRAPLGVYLVEGDSEFPHRGRWIDEAQRAGITPWPTQTTTHRVRDDVLLTGFGLLQSADEHTRIGRPGEGLHVVFGHRPAYALGDVEADLLLAGHTHGGQVQLPGFGPVMTLSKVPRSWAAGRTELEGGATLLVSRGVGMERAAAPRIRFWCRPEVMIVDVVPRL